MLEVAIIVSGVAFVVALEVVYRPLYRRIMLWSIRRNR
jgi:hypothetical protein